MVAQYNAPCRRAVSQAAGGGRDALGSDRMLRQAMKRQPRFIVAQSRGIISHRGPLENKRRLGKRTLTGAMYPTRPPAPSWHFEILSSAAPWQWQSPTTPSERRLRARELSLSKLCNKFLAWLEMSDADKPFIAPPIDINEQQSFSQTIDDFRLQISALGETESETAMDIGRKFCTSIQDRILAGQISVEEMVVALQPFNAACRQVLAGMQIGKKLSTMIRSSVLGALEAMEITKTGSVPDEMWTAMFAHIAGIKYRFHDVISFKRVLTAMPESARLTIPHDLLFTFTKTFVQAHSSRANLDPKWSWCCGKVGAALGRLSEDQWHELCISMEAFNQSRSTAEVRRKAKFGWLLTQAYSERVTNEALAAEYAELRGAINADSHRIWQLATARLRANGFLSRDTLTKLNQESFNQSLPQRWVMLTETLLSSKKPRAAIESLASLLTDMGETWVLLSNLIAAHAARPCVDTLRSVAEHSSKLDISLALQIASSDSTESESVLARWAYNDQAQHLATIMAYPKAESHIWRAIDAPGGNADVKMQLIDHLCTAYAASPILSKSQKMRRAVRAAFCQQKLTGHVSPAVVRHVVNSVTLDLDEGRWGRDRLLKWATQLVHDNVGADQAREMRKQLNGWRALIEQSGAAHTEHECTAKHDAFNLKNVKEVMEQEFESVRDGRSRRQPNRFQRF